MNKLIIVLPCYNEEEVLELSIDILANYLHNLINKKIISKNSFLCFIDDGSKDNTWKIIESRKNNNIVGIKLSNNYGHQNALLTGLFSNKNMGDMYITMDCDLQDDINSIEAMVTSFKKGNDIVYGVRSSRVTDTVFKRKSAEVFYELQHKIGIDIVKNHADFRLISNTVLKHLEKFNEVNIYLRAMFPVIGFKSDIVYYNRKERLAGETKYPLRKMLAFAWDGITSFSIFPLKVITYLGLIVFIMSMFDTLYVLIIKIFTDMAIPGWASVTVPIYFMGGVQLLSIGIIGEYIGKIYQESKHRPRYIIEKNTHNITP
jgi:glycosyltransferase involved in cell wall biosynthesis